MWALRVAVSSSVLGTSLVGGEARHATISVHLGEVDGTVKAARKVGYIDVKGELLVLHVELLVGGRRSRSHEVDTGADVGASLELQGEGRAGAGDTVCARVVGTIESAVGSACSTIRAQGSVPGVTSVAVGRATGAVEPAPVSVEHDGSRLSRARAGSRACLPGESGVGLSSESSDLLGVDSGEEGE